MTNLISGYRREPIPILEVKADIEIRLTSTNGQTEKSSIERATGQKAKGNKTNERYWMNMTKLIKIYICISLLSHTLAINISGNGYDESHAHTCIHF